MRLSNGRMMFHETERVSGGGNLEYTWFIDDLPKGNKVARPNHFWISIAKDVSSFYVFTLEEGYRQDFVENLVEPNSFSQCNLIVQAYNG
jgi:hypothetical protein